MKAVRTRARDQIDNGRAAEPVFGAEVRFLHFEFFDRIHRWRIGVHSNTAILLIVRGRHSVHEYVAVAFRLPFEMKLFAVHPMHPHRPP